MPRLTKLNDVLFTVEERPVYTSVGTASGERWQKIPYKKAIVNRDNGHVLGVVSQSYRLVSNREALDLAGVCCSTVFPNTKPVEWLANAIDAPATGGHCFIDLAHNSAMLDFTFVPAKDRPDTFGPFIRVTNSYNGLRALAFDIGYYRKVCKNGLILPESVIRFRYTHLQREIGRPIQFEIARDKLAKMNASFTEYLGVLKDTAVSREQFEPLMFAVLSLRKPGNATPGSREAADWDALGMHLKAMCDRYAGELGNNAYAAFNAITEFASQPPQNRCLYHERHGFQRRAGVWLSVFSRTRREPGFEIGRHIETISKSNAAEAVGAAYGRRA
jgi:hypothetical protein